MRERFVEFIVSSTTRNCRKDIVEYGIDIFIGESLCFISIIGLGYITGHKLESIIFSAGGVCTPTAGTNLCLYWTRRDSAYSNLKKTNWQTTFNRIYTLMGTSTTDGTYWPDPARTGIRNYFRERGYSSTNAYYSTCTSTTHFNDYIKAEINAGRPVLVATWGDEYYGDHTVLGLGYIRYKYNGVYSSHYIQIADGWTSSVNRYIHYETGRDSMMRIKVVPGN